MRTEDLLAWVGRRIESSGGTLLPFSNAEAAAAMGMNDLRQYGRVHGNIQSRIDFACYRAGLPPLGLAAEAPFDLAWNQDDRTWAFPVESMQAAARARAWSAEDLDTILRESERLPGQAHISWKRELAINEEGVRSWAFGLTGRTASPSSTVRRVLAPTSSDAWYWVFVCNPKKWAIDRFLEQRIEHDTWGIRPADREKFSPGQLGIIRVGVDGRSAAERDGKLPLTPGIYALCEVESEAFEATGASDEFWAEGSGREPGWPTVKIRYLKTYRNNPLTIEKLKGMLPDISALLLEGFPAASFPISGHDFRAVLALMGEEISEIPALPSISDMSQAKLAELEKKYLRASPEVKEKLSKTIERGPVGSLVKRALGFKCQLCEKLGTNPLGFVKLNGEHYAEAHHVMPCRLDKWVPSRPQISWSSAPITIARCTTVMSRSPFVTERSSW